LTILEQQEQQHFIRVIAELLKVIREEANVSQEETYLVTTINVARIENGSKDITLKTLKELCDFYGITVNEFFARLHTGFQPMTREAS